MKIIGNIIEVDVRELRALLLFASKDATRAHLHRLHFEAGDPGTGPAGVAVATDGHSMTVLRAEVVEPASWKTFAIPRPLAELIGRSAVTGTVAIDVEKSTASFGPAKFDVPQDELTFPPWRQVLPPARDDDAVGLIGIDPQFLARLNTVRVAADNADVLFQFGSGTDPVRVEIGTWTVVIMPMRCAKAQAAEELRQARKVDADRQLRRLAEALAAAKDEITELKAQRDKAKLDAEVDAEIANAKPEVAGAAPPAPKSRPRRKKSSAIAPPVWNEPAPVISEMSAANE